jgi:hypothetical protein
LEFFTTDELKDVDFIIDKKQNLIAYQLKQKNEKLIATPWNKNLSFKGLPIHLKESHF